MCQKVQTLTRRGVGDAAAGLGLHLLHMSEGPFSHDAGHYDIGDSIIKVIQTGQSNSVFYVIVSFRIPTSIRGM